MGCMELMLERLPRQSQEALDPLRIDSKQQETMREAEVARGTKITWRGVSKKHVSRVCAC